MKDRKVKQVLPRGWYLWEGKETRRGGIWWKYYIFMYENGTMRPTEAILRSGEG
jgi:hypothetical protein